MRHWVASSRDIPDIAWTEVRLIAWMAARELVFRAMMLYPPTLCLLDLDGPWRVAY